MKRAGSIAGIFSSAALLGFLLTAALAATATSRPSRGARESNAWCVATAQVPIVSKPYAWAVGGTTQCPSSSEHWTGTLDLRNNAGSSLSPYPEGISGNGNYGFIGYRAVCTGAIVHTFVYVNDNGHGTSDTSGTQSDCAY
jgi:hypothetical protein